MSTLTNWISSIGESPTFGFAMAHIFFAYFVVSLFSGTHQLIVAGVCLVVFGLKEFLYDIKFETSPPQTFMNSLDDFAGYVIGIALALAVTHYHW